MNPKTVRARVNLNCLVSEINDKTDPHKRPPKEGRQWRDKQHLITPEVDIEEWELRLEIIRWVLTWPTPIPPA